MIASEFELTWWIDIGKWVPVPYTGSDIIYRHTGKVPHINYTNYDLEEEDLLGPEGDGGKFDEDMVALGNSISRLGFSQQQLECHATQSSRRSGPLREDAYDATNCH